MTTPIKLGDHRPEPIVTQRRGMVSLWGEPGTGKSTFGLSGPRPVVLLATEYGLEGVSMPDGTPVTDLEASGDLVQYVIERPMAGYTARITEAFDELAARRAKAKDSRPATVAEAAREALTRAEWEGHVDAWHQFADLFCLAVEHPDAQLIQVDSATTVNEMARLAYVGQLQQVLPKDYGAAKAMVEGLLQRALHSRKNLVFTHRTKEIWRGNASTGEFGPAGYTDTNFLVPLVLRCEYAEGVYRQVVTRCRPNPAAVEREVPALDATGEPDMGYVSGGNFNGALALLYGEV